MKDNYSTNSWLSKEECAALRTIAILSIVVHNFAHKLPGAAVENEFAFNIENSINFSNKVLSSDFLIHIFSFWGHLGVPIFVFLSAYGLSLKYGNEVSINRKHFLLSHYKKLFIPLFLGTIASLVIMYFAEGHFSFPAARIVTQCTMVLNLIYPHEVNINPGPYWYFGMTMQLYVFYVFLVYRKSMKWLLVLMIASLALMVFLQNEYKILVWLKCNVIGWLLPFAIGIWSIKSDVFRHLFSRKSSIATFLVSALFLYFFGSNYYLWILIPAVTVCLAISFIKLPPISMWKPINAVGTNSMYVFVVHPLVRDIMLPLVPDLGRYGAMAIYIVSTLIIAFIVSQSVKMINGRISPQRDNALRKD